MREREREREEEEGMELSLPGGQMYSWSVFVWIFYIYIYIYIYNVFDVKKLGLELNIKLQLYVSEIIIWSKICQKLVFSMWHLLFCEKTSSSYTLEK